LDLPYFLQQFLVSTINDHSFYTGTIYNHFGYDFRGLGAGVERYVVTSLGGLSYEDFTFQQVANQWLVNLDIYTLRTGELATAIDNAHTNMQNIIDTLNQYPFLNDTTGVTDHNVVVITPVEPFDPGSGSRNAFLHQQIGLAVTEICTIIRVEP